MTVSLLGMLIDSAIKVSLIVLLALATTALLGKRSAAVRHWVLSATIACAAAMPALALIAPSWHVPFGALLAGRLESSAGAVFTPLAPNEDPAAAPDALLSPRERIRDGGTDVGPAAMVALWLTRIWMAGVALAVATLVVGLGRLKSIASRAQPVFAEMWVERAAAISARYGLKRRVVLLESDHPTLLVTWGIRRPTVILPRGASTWRDDRAQVVLAHELGHIRRADWAWHMAAQLIRCLYWFNPLVWLACKQLRVESERACDDAVLNLGVQGPEYATHLLDLAQAARQHRVSLLTGSGALAIARPSSLEGRITAMLNARLNRTSVTRSARVVTALAILIAAVTIAGFGASAQTRSRPSPAPLLIPWAAHCLTCPSS
jgi:beta-lactamase regulating signal transducer with metallopeptidase domain